MLNSSHFSGRRMLSRYPVNYFLTASLVALTLTTTAHIVGSRISEDSPDAASVQEVMAGLRQRIDVEPLAGVVNPMSQDTIGFMYDAPLEPTFSQFTMLTEEGLVLEPALPVIASLEDPDPTLEVAQSDEEDELQVAEATEEPRQPISILEAMAGAVKLGPDPAPEAQTEPVPIPVPRPADIRTAEPEAPKPQRVARAPVQVPAPVPAAPSPAPDNRSVIEKFFGLKPSSPPEGALGYASLNTGSIAPDGGLNGSSSPTIDSKTAVYDITAKVVIMPNGERLEAHSGLGDKMDDPRFVHVRMKGATPPGTYVLTEREALFHGVRALRMNPVGGSAAIYGRTGILTHTYLLGPNGDSNGCVSFKDYDRFLQAYLRGEVKRMVVVLSRGDALPRVANAR